jgi:mRNA-degrading endonuclease RelE of RelBE toxin-antitoxin system
MYDIELSDTAKRDLKWFKKYEQEIILDGIDDNLRFEPNVETQNRKPMRPNPIAEWELRIGKFRVLYNVEETVKIVGIEAIGIKVGSNFVIRGEKRDL